jgi:DNA (cytosine-5)-methyltransferase 1
MEEGVLGQAPIWTDLKTFDGKPWCGVVDILTGGWPCQPFSVSGRRAGGEDPRHLWPSVRRVAEETAVPVIFFENVDGHVSLGLEEVLGTLQEMGYEVETALVTAGEVGGTHRRKRLFGLASRGLEPARRLWSLFWMDPLANGLGAGVGRGDKRPHRASRPTLLEPQDRAHAPDQPRDGRETLVSPGGSAVGLFPPIPGDEAWWKILEEEPLLEPALRNVADELAPGVAERWFQCRKDQLRALGNGVVPACAAYAFGLLLHQMLE